MLKEKIYLMPPAARGALFEKTAPLDPPQKLFIKLKASIPGLQTNSYEMYDIRHFVAFSADSVHLKKPSRWPKALIGPPCHGAPGPPEKAFN
jgi:hypothetical protein